MRNLDQDGLALANMVTLAIWLSIGLLVCCCTFALLLQHFLVALPVVLVAACAEDLYCLGPLFLLSCLPFHYLVHCCVLRSMPNENVLHLGLH